MPDRESPRNAEPRNSSLVSLQEVLVRTQQSLARAVESAQEAVKSETSFSIGDRPMYVIEGIDLELSAGINPGGERSLQLDFDAPGDQRSRLKFRVVRKPMEVAQGEQLIVSNLDPLGTDRSHIRLRILYFKYQDGSEEVRSDAPIRLCFAESGDVKARHCIELKTDRLGRAEVHVDLIRQKLQVVAAGSDRQDLELEFLGECYIWAEADLAPAAEANQAPATEATMVAAAVAKPAEKTQSLPPILSSKTLILPIRSYRDSVTRGLKD